ncbi:RNA polymerase sigma-70 factor [Pedobacter sp. KR3-3]|uniref:RNA polymerase sigma-70 factor n=1 Tax=Pedobacter albus TaxID=3113905 RepID=A0ABU7I6Q0_9SPHI|nr:RNA polymerase sigma-70 factor [Pedobacter sp. KR3-3]MEE1945021.1 RNA polymerase sigma-70 factor [Pedobacter sp. KR3-3]
MTSPQHKLWPDNDLLASLCNNDHSAFEKIYNKYWSKLYVSAFNLLRNRELCEDILQDIFTQLWLKRTTNKIDNLNNYLLTSVKFQVFKAIRDGKGRTDLLITEEIINDPLSPENFLNEKELNRILDENIEQLPEKCREIFILSRKNHLTVKQIATRLNISPKTVENQITIAIKRLRLNMGDFLFWLLLFLYETWN